MNRVGNEKNNIDQQKNWKEKWEYSQQIEQRNEKICGGDCA